MKKSYPTYAQSFGLLLIMLLCGAVAGVVTMPFISPNSGAGLAILYVGAMLGAMCAGLSARRNWQFETRSFPIAVLILGVFAMISMHLVLDPLVSLMPIPDFLNQMFQDVQNQPYLFLFLLVIAAPVLEEAIFRGIILDGFLKNYKPLHAITASAFIFALVHGNLVQGIGAFMLGLLMGWIYWKTKSIFLCILLHLINNLIAYIGTLMSSEEDYNKSLHDFIGNDGLYVMVILLGLTVTVTSIWFIQKRYFAFFSEPSAEQLPMAE